MNGVATALMSTKGQVVIPQQVRRSLGLETGTRFVVTARDDLIVLKVLVPLQSADLAPLLKQTRAAKRG